MTKFISKRLSVLFDEIRGGGSFADIGCDHGYVAEKVILSGKSDKAYISDISEKCLKKADERLKVSCSGKYEAVVSDGFEKIPFVDEALIAGMGGELIVKILKREKRLPTRLVLQPMKHSAELRRTLFALGYGIVKDYTFKDCGKFYDVIVAEKNVAVKKYTADEETFGRDNLLLKSDDFLDLARAQLSLFEDAAKKARGPEKQRLLREIEKRKEILK